MANAMVAVFADGAPLGVTLYKTDALVLPGHGVEAVRRDFVLDALGEHLHLTGIKRAATMVSAARAR